MPYSESQKRSAARWDKANMAAVACRVTVQKKERFKAACDKLGTTMYAVFIRAIDETIARAEKGDD